MSEIVTIVAPRGLETGRRREARGGGSNARITINREVELKLEGAPGAVEAAFLAISGDDTAPKPRVRNLASTYFDTVDGALRAQGCFFRVRKVYGRYIAALKSRDDATNTHVRREIEARLPSSAPEISNLEPQLAEALVAIIGDAPLVERFTTRVRRETQVVMHGGAEIEVAFDTGFIIAVDDRRAAIRELEFELKKGEFAALFECAEMACGAHGLRLAPFTKAERGFLLASGEAASERRGRTPEIPEAANLDEVVGIVGNECLDQFTANWPPLSGPHEVEAVHQMRVSLRRLRTAFSMFNRALPCAQFEYFRVEAGQLASDLSVARDMDAFIAQLKKGPIARFGRDGAFDALLGSAEARRAAGYARARAVVAAPRTSQFVLELRAFLARRSWRNALAPEELSRLDEAGRDFAMRTLARLDRRALKRGKKLAKLSPDERHEFRLALKHVRYAADFFTGYFAPAKAKKYNRTVAKLQDILGVYNDSLVATEGALSLEQIAGSQASRAAGVMIGWCGRASFDADSSLLKAYRSYRDADRFW